MGSPDFGGDLNWGDGRFRRALGDNTQNGNADLYRAAGLAHRRGHTGESGVYRPVRQGVQHQPCRYVERRSEFVIFSSVTEEELQEEHATIVAGRGTRYVQFFDRWKTRFEFASNEERWKLEGALLCVGWRTWDRD